MGENGAFYFAYDHTNKRMIRRYFKTEAKRAEDKGRIQAIQEEILARVPGCRVSEDQPYRVADLAIDFCEDVAPLGGKEIKAIVQIFESHGAVAKRSSIHVNGWFGNYDKLTMTKLFLKRCLGLTLKRSNTRLSFQVIPPMTSPCSPFFPMPLVWATLSSLRVNSSISLPGSPKRRRARGLPK